MLSRATKTGQKKKGILKRIFSKLFAKRSAISNDSLAFFNFFQRSENLRTFFDSKEKANIFYTTIRCGLLHQGQTKGKSLIHIRKAEPVLNWINDKETDVSIQRRLFVKEVKKIYEKYVEELQKKNNLKDRRKFARKMKYIVDQR